jgi:hypothetical protein
VRFVTGQPIRKGVGLWESGHVSRRFPLGSAFATTITNLNSAWLPIDTSPTYVLPGEVRADQVVGEPVGHWLLSDHFVLGGYVNILGDNGISDTITFTNIGPPGFEIGGEIKFYSDTPPGDLSGLIGSTLSCSEPCVFSHLGFALVDAGGNTRTMFVNIASNFDGLPFRPFGSPIDASDAIQFNVPAPVPLPAALPLFASGLGGFGLMARWRRRRIARAN